MTQQAKKLLGNRSLAVSVRVNEARLKHSGVRIDRDLLADRPAAHAAEAPESNLPEQLIKRLAGIAE